MSSGNDPEKPIKSWKEYKSLEMISYVSRNFDKADCSFVINDPIQNNSSKRELRSFKWILFEISPMLKEILTDEKNSTKNFKSIPVSDKNFESLLSYAHTKKIINKSFGYLLDFYESSKQYNSELLSNAITCALRSNDPTGYWIKFAAIAYREFSTENAQILDALNSKLTGTKNWTKVIESELTSNVETVLCLDSELFLSFLEFTRDNTLNPLICFKATEAYLLKNIFKGETPNKIEEEDNLIIDQVNNSFQYIEFSQMRIEDFNSGPAKSTLLDEQSKKYFHSLVRK